MRSALVTALQIYIAVGLTSAIFFVRANRRLDKVLRADPTPAAGAALWVRRSAAALPWWQRWPMVPLQFLAAIAVWPVPYIAAVEQRIRHGPRPAPGFREERWGGSEEQLTADYLSRYTRRSALIVCGGVGVAVFAARLVTGGEDAVGVVQFVSVMVIGTAARQVQDLLAGKFTVSFAKRSGMPLPLAYRDALITAVADLGTLTMSSAILLRWRPAQGGGGLHARMFGDQLRAALHASHVTELPHAFQQSVPAGLIGIASITFYASLLTPLKTGLMRRRTGDDLVAGADHALRLGRIGRARQLLAAARTRKPSEVEASWAEARICLVEGDTAAALAAAQTVVRLKHPDENLDEQRQREDAMLIIRDWCQELDIEMQPSLLETARDAGVHDSFVAVLRAGSPPISDADLSRLLEPDTWPLAHAMAAHDRDEDPCPWLPPAHVLTGIDLMFRNQIARSWRLHTESGEEPHSKEAALEAYARDLLSDLATLDDSARKACPDWFRQVFARALVMPLFTIQRSAMPESLLDDLLDASERLAPGYLDQALYALERNIVTHTHRSRLVHGAPRHR